MNFDEQTGEEVTKVKTKHIKVSTTDKDSGHYHKGEHKQCFAYTHNTATDKNGFVLAHETVPGNVHDSVSFDKVREKVMDKFSDKITFEVLDAGFKTPAICRTIIEDNKIPLMPYTLMPYTRPKGSKEVINKKEFIYDNERDIYICPNNEILTYKTVTKEDLKIYKSNPAKCINCPFKEKCTRSKTNQKSISRHVWEEYVEMANELRYTQTWKDIYPLRKETVERTFADCKENMCLRFTRVRGLEKNRSNALMIFTCHNLKKMALWKHRSKELSSLNNAILDKFLNFINFYKEKAVYFFKYTTLSTN